MLKIINKMAKKKPKRAKKKVQIESLDHKKGRRMGALEPDKAVFYALRY
jgi:hypothetical protein